MAHSSKEAGGRFKLGIAPERAWKIMESRLRLQLNSLELKDKLC